MIPFNCPHCGKGLSATAKQADKNVSCPHCGASVTVPGPAASLRKEAAEAIYGERSTRDELAADLRRDDPSMPPRGPRARAKRSVLSKPLREYRGGDLFRLYFWVMLFAACLILGGCVLLGVLFGGCGLVAHVLSGR
jgi:DNA-directed RNA polymerase subunit RPC12/RpoP